MAMRMQLSLPQRQMGVTSPSRNFSYPNDLDLIMGQTIVVLEHAPLQLAS